jgi:hypothetical protein
LSFVLRQGVDNLCGVAGAARFNEQSNRLEIPQYVPQLFIELQLSHAAQTSGRDEAHVELSARGLGDTERIETGIRKFVENDHPRFLFGLVGHQTANGRGLAGSEAAGYDMRMCHACATIVQRECRMLGKMASREFILVISVVISGI